MSARDIYYRDRAGRLYEFEATTSGGVWMWVRRLDTGESMRVKVAVLTAVPESEILAWAAGQTS
jgi:hypothetical protein